MGKRLAWSESTWFQWTQLTAGLLLGALGYRMFLVPNDIAAGGFTGIGQLVNHFLSWPVGAVALALNVPLFALSMGRLGLKFGLKSLLASVALSLLIDHLPVGPFTQDPILAAIFGGVVAGAGFGLVLRGGATTGGSDMLGKLVSSRVPVVTVGAVTFTVDVLVIACSAFVFDADKALLAMVSAFLMNRMLDGVLTGPSRAKAYYIISPHSQRIAQRIMEEMDRGVTGLAGRGMYSQKDMTILMCVIGRLEALQLRRIVSQVDPEAFVIVTDVHEALGEGFNPNN